MSKLQGTTLINFFANPILVPTYIHDLFLKKKHFLRCCTSIVVANCLGYVYAAWAWSIYSTKVQSGKCNVYSFGVERALLSIYRAGLHLRVALRVCLVWLDRSLFPRERFLPRLLPRVVMSLRRCWARMSPTWTPALRTPPHGTQWHRG